MKHLITAFALLTITLPARAQPRPRPRRSFAPDDDTPEMLFVDKSKIRRDKLVK